MQPLLNVLDYQPVSLSFVPEERFDAAVPQRAQITTTFTLARNKDNLQRFAIGLICRLFKGNEDENIPYTTEFTLSGEFWSNLQLDDRGVPARVVNNAIMILYGIARGIVGQATAGGVHGRFVIPSVVFDELVLTAVNRADSGVISDEAFSKQHALTADLETPQLPQA